ncbi:flagellar basal-body MS-ring/collar protein FliF [Burkholderia sp. BCC1977]|uniref:flagellar basal-body MS-ring/collar protein FliF n=1 Tax=Burkholderia sp. BCC1977 TaxID=2817440 RepID=UPI002ABDAA8A|nr:flagellar basal-body MS-ring/collar protein FliF [Burkholderia sp. BCC1977]
MTLLSRYRARFSDAPPGRQLAWIAGLVALIAAVAFAGYWALRPSYQVLFSDLKPQDAAAIIAELERQKVPFRIDEASHAILVPDGDTRATRLKLMSADLRLRGTVGFELFNNSDLGLTDFAQKVNYQRALQGELARTIMSLDEIDMARVHLTLPESSIFRRVDDRPKASVALFARDGQTLTPDTIGGIQRLIAAAIPQMAPADVTVVDQRGGPVNSRESDLDDPHYALKHAIEREYVRKITGQIAPLIGALHATVSVDAALDFDQVRTTRESGISQPIVNDNGTVPALPAGKQALPPAGLPPLPSPAAANDGTRSERRVEQIVSAPGAIKRLSVGIVVDGALPDDALERLRTVASAAVGANTARGDTVSAFASRRAAHPSSSQLLAPVPVVPGDHAARPAHPAHPANSTYVAVKRDIKRIIRELDPLRPLVGYLGVTGLISFVVLRLVRGAWVKRRRTRLLSESERERYVLRLRTLLADARGQHGG